jgi:hypothetical protein
MNAREAGRVPPALRDVVAQRVANVVINVIATRWYRGALDRFFRLGLACAREHQGFREPPGSGLGQR